MEKRDPGQDSDDLIMQQYPSPTADGQDLAQYYAASAQRDPQLDPQIDQAMDGQHPDAAAQQQERRPSVSAEELQLAAQLSQGLAPMMEVNHEEHDVQNHDPGLQDQDHSLQGPEQALHAQGPSLQVQDPNLHTQEPAMHESDPSFHHPQEADMHTQDHALHSQDPNFQSQDPNLQPHDPNLQGHDPNLQGHDPNLQGHDPNMQGHDPNLQGHDPNLQPHDPSLHHGLPHPDQQQPHQYGESPQQPQHLPTPLQMAQFAQQAGGYVPVDSTPPRKRSKVSRACDECRRKKVKCDAISETGEESCSNCRRSQIQCLFSRVPQKRGPSKGYIKELADRINSIEGKLGSQVLEGLDLNGARRESGSYSPSAPLNENAKRPFSSISGDGYATPTPNRQTTWGSEPRPNQTFQTPQGPREAQSPISLVPRPLTVKPNTSETPAPATEENGVDVPSDHIRGLDDPVFHSFMSIIYPSLPFLASTKQKIEDTAAKCQPALRAAFIEALYATMESFQAIAPQSGDPRLANRLLFSFEIAPGSRSDVENLVHLQTLLLLAIEADNHGPQAIKGRHGGPPKSALLARAVDVAYGMGLREKQVEGSFDFQADADSDDKVAMRAWWALVALDRFNAVGTGKPMLIHERTTVLPPASILKPLFGEAGACFIKIIFLLGSYEQGVLSPVQPRRRAWDAPPIHSNKLGVALELWQYDVPADITPASHPVVFLTYWHCRLLAYLLLPSVHSTEVLWAAKETLKVLSLSTQLVSPLNHYFTSLATLSLAKLTKVDKTREQASKLLLENFLEGSIAPSTWDNAIRDKVAEMMRSETAVSGGSATAAAAEAASAANQNLQHLADLAAAAGADSGSAAGAGKGGDGAGVDGADGGAGATAAEKEWPPSSVDFEDLGFNPRPMLHAGYLSAMIPPAATTAADAAAAADAV